MTLATWTGGKYGANRGDRAGVGNRRGADERETFSRQRDGFPGSALYVPYRAEPTKVVDALQRPELYFEAGLVRAMMANSEAAARRGEVPELDGDPICDCQDYVPFQPMIGPVKLTGNRAEATVRFNNGTERLLHYNLIATRKGWRIYDIRTSDYSLRGLYKL